MDDFGSIEWVWKRAYRVHRAALPLLHRNDAAAPDNTCVSVVVCDFDPSPLDKYWLSRVDPSASSPPSRPLGVRQVRQPSLPLVESARRDAAPPPRRARRAEPSAAGPAARRCGAAALLSLPAPPPLERRAAHLLPRRRARRHARRGAGADALLPAVAAAAGRRHRARRGLRLSLAALRAALRHGRRAVV